MRAVKWTAFLVLFSAFFLAPAHAFEIEMGEWKGAGILSFQGKCIDSTTGAPIDEFSVEVKMNKAIKNRKRIETDGGRYNFTMKTTTRKGRRFLRDWKKFKTLGPSSDSVTLTIQSRGYEPKIITLTQDRVLIDQVNEMDISLQKASEEEFEDEEQDLL